MNLSSPPSLELTRADPSNVIESYPAKLVPYKTNEPQRILRCPASTQVDNVLSTLADSRYISPHDTLLFLILPRHPPLILYPSLSTNPTHNTMQSSITSPNPPNKSHSPKTPLSPQALQATSSRLFSPFLKSPRIPTQPNPPALASSRLPPPAAEIDERPRYRVRRFRLWRDNAPALRKIVLDPTQRGEYTLA